MTQQEQFQNYIIEMRRGSLTMAVLGCLYKSHYGYALLQTLQEKGIDIEANTLYPLLRRLESQGLLISNWDTSESRPRKYYSISEKGKQVFHELVLEWKKMQASLELVYKEI
ncbi:PadR family transcriptional regulator PadR [Breznakia sp. PF5-3]|uniref:PadR family transcriptional regulator n=1 Tax=unclassified Breznakia TaxID=2623764 RepID=UPI002406C0BD|nr:MULTISPECIES: PadR family transcriptional regulator [unclassified Breznakia]MDF9825434.1 PadR family transcriptional regulator PadR [Breznakia sp. PM6-1]MDF9836312.1 PadR family transcriptional regulator PadR [Breznakia sp. PF5-3]